MADAPLVLWFRRDLRLADQPMLAAAAATGRPLVPLFILDPETEALGAAPKWRLGLAVEAFAAALKAAGSRLCLRRGPALAVIEALLAETGATGVRWTRLWAPDWRARDEGVRAALTARGIEVATCGGHTIHEPLDIATGKGEPYRVYTPFWKAVRGRPVPPPSPAPSHLPPPEDWPLSDRLADWRMGAAMRPSAGARITLLWEAARSIP